MSINSYVREPFYIICVANALDQTRLALHNIKDLVNLPNTKTSVIAALHLTFGIE